MSRTTPAVHAARRWIGLVALASLAATAGSAFAQSEQDQLVRDAQTTFSNFVRNPDMTWFSTSGGRGGAIAPKIVRAGWIFGSSGTRGAVFAVESGRWSGPAFYNVGTASVGFRLGSTSRKPSPGHDRQGLNSLMAVR
jgi:lipid-binding SYLF domain-containing protein